MAEKWALAVKDLRIFLRGKGERVYLTVELCGVIPVLFSPRPY